MSTDRPPVLRHTVEKPPPEIGAAEHLRYIRDMMERSGSFTAVPGYGAMAMGATALAAAWIAARQSSEGAWLEVWLYEAVVAFVIGVVALARKSRKVGVSLHSGPARKYFLSLVPPLLAGALLTAALWGSDGIELLPVLWLLLYGAGTITGGAYSVRVIPIMGVLFMVIGTVALLAPSSWTDALMATGFGGLHVVCGWVIARNHGG
jgi:hypothetical protein